MLSSRLIEPHSTDMMYHCAVCDIFFHKSMQYYEHKRDQHPKLTCTCCDAVFLARKKFCRHKQSCARVRYNRKNREARKNNSLPMKTAGKFEDKLKNDNGKDQCKFKRSETNSVSCKSDFMNLIGLTFIEKTTSIDRGVTSTHRDKLLDKMKRCRVIIVGEHCKICSEFFKCNTDLESHRSKHHIVENKDVVVVVLKIGKEVLSKIRLKKRYLRPNVEAVRRLRPSHFYKPADNAHAYNEYATTDEQGRNNTEPASNVFLNNDASYDDSMCRPVRHRECTEIVASRKNDACCLSDDIGNARLTDGNTIRSQDARKEVVVLEDDVETPENVGSLDFNYNSGDKSHHEWQRIYDAELVPNPLFSTLTINDVKIMDCEKVNDNSDDDVMSGYSNATTAMWEDMESDIEIHEVKQRMPLYFDDMSACSFPTNHKRISQVTDYENNCVSGRRNPHFNNNVLETEYSYAELNDIFYEQFYAFRIEAKDRASNNNNPNNGQNKNIDGGLNRFSNRVSTNGLNMMDEETQTTSSLGRFEPFNKDTQSRCRTKQASDRGSLLESTIYRDPPVIIKEELMLEDYTYYANDIKYCDV